MSPDASTLNEPGGEVGGGGATGVAVVLSALAAPSATGPSDAAGSDGTGASTGELALLVVGGISVALPAPIAAPAVPAPNGSTSTVGGTVVEGACEPRGAISRGDPPHAARRVVTVARTPIAPLRSGRRPLVTGADATAA
jgi:hypothetical protein